MRLQVKSERLKGGYGPYYGAGYGHTITAGNQVLHVFTHDGYNAMGLIGTERNGVAMVSVTDRQVVFDCAKASGKTDTELVDEIIQQPDPEALRDFLDSRVRYRLRYNPVTAAQSKQSVKQTQKTIHKNVVDELVQDSGDVVKVLKGFESVITARIAAGREATTEDLMEVDRLFPPKVYKMMHLYLGFLAHYNREGFFDAQLRDYEDFCYWMGEVARSTPLRPSEPTEGNRIRYHASRIASAYLSRL